MGGNASAQEIGKHLEDAGIEIPTRTIRYRISMLMERGMLLPSVIQTDERKIGLGEGILILQECSDKTETLEKILKEIPIFFWHVPTHGKFDGYLVHVAYNVSTPKMIDVICKEMKKRKLISDYYFFDIVDFASKKVDFSRFKPSGKWDMDWNEWAEKIAEHLDHDVKSPFNLSEQHEIIEHDSRDIDILKHLLNNSNTSISALSILLKTPITKIRESVKKLRDTGVIKGYERAYGFAGDLLWFSCFLDISDCIGGILSCFNELPFPVVILMQKKNQYCIRLGLTTSYLKRFLDGFRLIRPYLKSYSFQFHLTDIVESSFLNIFDLYKENKWVMPVEEYIAIIQSHDKS
jgi:DNA-binding Lrp family transcriptional regulator